MYDLNMVTSPKRSITRRTSRRSAKVRAEGCSLRKTVRAEREEAIVVGIIEESWLVIRREESDEVKSKLRWKIIRQSVCAGSELA